MSNLYWPMYQRLEQELINLSEFIYIDDKQLPVYSIKLAELLMRCSMEIESISKEMYSQYASKFPKDCEPYFDTDCINLLESKWKLGSKKVIISHQNFFLSDQKRNIFPLRKANKRGSSGSKWKQAYQAIKHNRTKNMSRANIENLLTAMAALYLLNIYYMNKEFNVLNGKDDKFIFSLSSLFTLNVHHCDGYSPMSSEYIKNRNFEECTYVIKWKNEYEDKINERNAIFWRQLYVALHVNDKSPEDLEPSEFKEIYDATMEKANLQFGEPEYIAKLNIES